MSLLSLLFFCVGCNNISSLFLPLFLIITAESGGEVSDVDDDPGDICIEEVDVALVDAGAKHASVDKIEDELTSFDGFDGIVNAGVDTTGRVSESESGETGIDVPQMLLISPVYLITNEGLYSCGL